MSRRPSALLLVLLFSAPAYADKKPIHPLLRFSVSTDASIATEYLGDLHSDYAVLLKNAKLAKGAMQVECSDVKQLGVAFEPLGIGHWIYGANTKYRFAWRHLGYPDDVVNRMRFHRNYRSGLIENRIDFGSKLSRWLVGGIIRMELTVLGEVRFKTDFELVNCGVTIEMPPEREPMQDILDRIEKETQRR